MRIILALLLVSSFSAACANPADDDAQPLVVATTTILGDVVSNILGTDVALEVLMSPGADPHEFEASARQAASLYEADLVVANGLGLEEGLEDLLADVSSEGVRVLEVGPLVDPIPLGDDGDLDPHVWLDPARMAEAVTIIADELDRVLPSGPWRERGGEYRTQLETVDVEIESMTSAIPLASRVLVTGHRAFGYFADRYEFRVIGTIIPSASTMAEPSAAEFAALADLVEEAGVPAIFTDRTESQGLAETLADQVGRQVEVIALYTGSFDEQPPGPTSYLEMLEWDARAIVEALDQ